MSTLGFTSPEIRLATATLAALAALIPLAYLVWPSRKQSSTPHVQTFEKLLKSFSTLRPQAITANASRDFTHTVLPQSLDLPSRNMQTIHRHAAMVLSLFETFEMIPQANGNGDAVHFSTETNTVIAHCKMGGKVNGANEMGAKLRASGMNEWWTEGVLFVRMTPDGKQVVEVREFVDNAKAEELQRLLGDGIFRD
jgi:hypothetical protein